MSKSCEQKEPFVSKKEKAPSVHSFLLQADRLSDHLGNKLNNVLAKAHSLFVIVAAVMLVGLGVVIRVSKPQAAPAQQTPAQPAEPDRSTSAMP